MVAITNYHKFGSLRKIEIYSLIALGIEVRNQGMGKIGSFWGGCDLVMAEILDFAWLVAASLWYWPLSSSPYLSVCQISFSSLLKGNTLNPGQFHLEILNYTTKTLIPNQISF